MSLAMRDKIVEKLSALEVDGLPAFKTVEGFGGEFGLAEVKRHWDRPPAAMVAPIRVLDGERSGGEPMSPIEWVVCIVCRGRAEQALWDLAASLAFLVYELAVRERWDGLACKPSRRVRAINKFSGQLDRAGVAIWFVGWEQAVEFSKLGTDPGTLAELVHMHVETTVGSNDDATTTLEAGDPLD